MGRWLTPTEKDCGNYDRTETLKQFIHSWNERQLNATKLKRALLVNVTWQQFSTLNGYQKKTPKTSQVTFVTKRLRSLIAMCLITLFLDVASLIC